MAWVAVDDRVEVKVHGEWREGVVVSDRRYMVSKHEVVVDDEGGETTVETQELHESADVMLADGIEHVTIHSAASAEDGPEWRI